MKKRLLTLFLLTATTVGMWAQGSSEQTLVVWLKSRAWREDAGVILYQLETTLRQDRPPHHAAAKPAMSIASSTSFDGYIDVMAAINKIKFPVNLPLFQTRPLPRLDVKGSGSASLKLTFPQAKFDWNPTIIFDTDKWPMISYNEQKDDPDDKAEESPIDTGDLELSLSGSLQVGIAFSANIETNDWIEDIFSSGIELGLMVGPKLEGSLSLSTAGMAQSGAYGALKNSKIAFHPISADLEAKAELKFLWKDKESTTFLEGAKQWGTVDWYIFPDFKEVTAGYNKSGRNIEFYTKTKNKTFLPNFITAGLYDYDDNLIENYQHYDANFLFTDSMEVRKNFNMKKAGTYKLKYGLRTVGYDINAGTEWVKVPPYIQHATENLLLMVLWWEGKIPCKSKERLRI